MVIRGLILFLALICWIAIPHLLTGITCVVGMALFCICCSALFTVLNRRYKRAAVSTMHIQVIRKVSICIGSSVLVILLLSLFIDVNRVRLYVLYGAIISALYILMQHLILSSSDRKSDMSERMGSFPMRVGEINLVLSIICVQRATHIENDWKLIYFALALGICLGFFFHEYVSDQGRKFSSLWLSCICAAFLLTYSLNVVLDTSSGQLVSYVADSYHDYTTTCLLEDGSSFGYTGCPIETGEKGYIYQYTGWFRITHFIPPGD